MGHDQGVSKRNYLGHVKIEDERFQNISEFLNGHSYWVISHSEQARVFRNSAFG